MEDPNQAGGVVTNLDMDAMRRNMRQIDLIRIVMFMVGGLLCGVLGFTGVEGLICYMVVSLLVGAGIAARMGFQVKKYTADGSPLTLVMGGATSQVMSFIMFWTLTYSLAYIY